MCVAKSLTYPPISNYNPHTMPTLFIVPFISEGGFPACRSLLRKYAEMGAKKLLPVKNARCAAQLRHMSTLHPGLDRILSNIFRSLHLHNTVLFAPAKVFLPSLRSFYVSILPRTWQKMSVRMCVLMRRYHFRS